MALDNIGTKITGNPCSDLPASADYGLFPFYDSLWRRGWQWQAEQSQTRPATKYMECFNIILNKFEERLRAAELLASNTDPPTTSSTAELQDMYAMCLHHANSIKHDYDRLQVILGAKVNDLLFWCERHPEIAFKPKRQAPKLAVARASSKRFEPEQRRPQPKKKSRKKQPRGGCAWHLPCSMTVEEMR